MAISYVGSATASATTLTMPAGRQVGDLEIMWAFNSASTTQPTIPSGWKRISNQAGTTCDLVVAYRWCVDGSDTAGTWTNASSLICEVYRGVYGVGDAETASGSGTAVTYQSNFPYQTGGASWVLEGVGHRTATSLGTTPSGLTARATVGTNPILSAYDTNGGVASFSSAKTSTANASSGWVNISIELLGANSMWDPAARGGAGEYIVSFPGGLVSTLSTNPAAATVSATTLGRISGSLVFRFVNGNKTSGGLSVGLATNTTASLGSTTSSVGWNQTTGVVTLNGVTIGTAATWASASAALYGAVNFTTMLIWFRVGTGGNWNNDPTANPDTGVGGFDISTLALTAALTPARGAAASAGTETTGTTFDGAAASHGLSTFATWDTLSTGVAGTLAATEDADTAAFAGLTAVFGGLAATEGADTAAFAGGVLVSGSLTATEGSDTASFAALRAGFGALAATEGADTASAAGLVGLIGALASTEGADTAAMSGQAFTAGTLATTEAADTAALAGDVISGPSGVLAATEAADTAALAGELVTSGTLAATELPDTAAFSFITVSGVLAATELADLASFGGNVPTSWLPQPPGAEVWAPQDAGASPLWTSKGPASGNWSPA